MLVLALLLLGCQPHTPIAPLSVAVMQASGGRDLEVAGVSDQPELTERIRLEGIDVPDVTQTPWGEAAKATIERQVRGQTVQLETDAEPRDAIGRRLAYVWHQGKLLNETLVAEGYALATPHPPNSRYDQRLARAQDRARVLGLGLWNPQNPMRLTPAEFRGQK